MRDFLGVEFSEQGFFLEKEVPELSNEGETHKDSLKQYYFHILRTYLKFKAVSKL